MKKFEYAYNSVNDIMAIKRDGNVADGDGYEYDLTQQITNFHQKGNVDLAGGTVTGAATNHALEFDGCGNRTKNDGVVTGFNELNQPNDLWANRSSPVPRQEFITCASFLGSRALQLGQVPPLMYSSERFNARALPIRRCPGQTQTAERD